MADKKLQLLLGEKKTIPSDIGWDDLKFAIDQLRAAVFSRCKELGQAPKDRARFSLVALDAGSVVPTLEYEDALENAALDVCNAVAAHDLRTLSATTAEHIYEIERRLAARNIRWTVAPDRKRPPKSSYISVESPLPEPPSLVEGWTVLYGECVRAGGEPPKVRLRLNSGQTLSILCSKSVAQHAASRLYRTIALKGPATWRPDDMEIVKFRAEEWVPYSGEDLELSIRSLREAVGEPWRGKSVAEVYRRLREDD